MTINENLQAVQKSAISGRVTIENNGVPKPNSVKATARITGALILIMAIIAPFSMLYVPSALIVSGDAAATANNIMASEALFRLGIVGDSVVFLIEIVLSVLLYVLLRPVSRPLSLIVGFSRLAMTVLQGINLLNSFIPLLLLSGASYLTVFEPDQLQALAMLFLDAHQSVVVIWGLSFGLHLFVLGYLVYKSGYIPRIIGVLLVVASLCYLIQSFGNILFPNYGEVFALVGFISIVEIALPLWLLIKGVNVEQWEKRIHEAA
jgi:hypothetical protein